MSHCHYMYHCLAPCVEKHSQVFVWQCEDGQAAGQF